MSKIRLSAIIFSIIGIVLVTQGVHFYDSAWAFPGNLFSDDFKASFPLSSIPLMVVALLGTGIYMTFKLGFPQLKRIAHGIRVTKGDYDQVEDEGDLIHFKALSTALAATVGIGNIAGVAIAIYYGGPGALFWMWITAFFGTALKYAECTLALEYRETDSLGNTAGGPMYTIENGLGPNWRWLAATFACFTIICSFFTGNAIQSNTLTQQLYAQISSVTGSDNALMVTNSFSILGSESNISIMHVIIGLTCSFIVGSVILGGIKRIGNVTSYLVPIMAAVYVMCALFIILTNFGNVGESFNTIFSMAFNPPSIKDPAIGIAAGAFISFLNTMMMGVKRGLFSSESGQGSAAIAHSTAKTPYAVREGVVALLEPYIDTIIICTLTGLVIMVTNSWHLTEFYSQRIDTSILPEDLKAGVLLTSHAFGIGIPSFGAEIVTIAVVLFALSTAISWSFYGDRATEYLFGSKAIPIYRYCYVFMVFVGSMLTLEQVWIFGDAALAFMTFPNLIAIILLSNKLKDLSNEYFEKY
jgi:alanine or glycine:cation symporter, AGCS family